MIKMSSEKEKEIVFYLEDQLPKNKHKETILALLFSRTASARKEVKKENLTEKVKKQTLQTETAKNEKQQSWFNILLRTGWAWN